METLIKDLKTELSKYDTRELLEYVSTKFITFGNDAADVSENSDIFNKTSLSSPQKQYTYLVGLLMSTEYSGSETKDESLDVYTGIEDKIQEITNKYIENFFDVRDADGTVIKDKVKKYGIALNSFISYFDMDVLRYEEQTESLIKELYMPFNNELINDTGLGVEDYLGFYHYVHEKFIESLNKPKKAIESVTKFLDSLSLNPSNIEEEYKKLLSGNNGEIAREVHESLDAIFTITKQDILNKFGENKGIKLMNYFALERKERDFQYYNSKNPFAERPLCWVDEHTLFIVHSKFLINAVYGHITEVLEKPSNKYADKYKAKKAEVVEKLFLKSLKNIFSEEAIFHTTVCEVRGTNEHDILIEYKNKLIIVEVKASKVREPFFNPEKSFVRIRDHFNSASGIGGAYSQADILRKFITSSNEITLFEEKNKKFTLSNTQNKDIIIMVMTLEQFGSIAINTSDLLIKEDGEKYPWVCNLHDLNNINEILKYLGKTVDDFLNYVNWRIEKHASIIASDELDVLETYCLDMEGIKKRSEQFLFFWPTGPSIIDKIYFKKHGVPYAHPILDKPKLVVAKSKIGRNDKCPCGSGKKYKKCCIDLGIY